MKKAGKILAGAMLGIAFTGAVGVYCWQYDVGGIQGVFKEEETENETSKQLKVKLAERKVYELGEEVDCGGFIWKINSAEITQDYSSLDEYYHTRPIGLVNPSDLIKKRHYRSFEEETRFLILRATLTNTSEDPKEYNCAHMQFYNSYKDGEYEKLWFDSFGRDVKCVSETGEIKQIQEVQVEYIPFLIEGKETAEVEYIIEYSEYPGYADYPDYVYDLYLSTLSLAPESEHTDWEIDHKIHLNVAPKHVGINRTELGDAYDEQVNIPEMKCRQWANLEMKEYQEEGYPTLYEKDGIVEEYTEEVTEENYLFDRMGITRQISNIQIVDWETLPKDFADRGVLQKMAEQYEQSYGYSQDQMKILILDIDFSKPAEEEFEEGYGRYGSIQKVDFYWYTYLYTRDENEKRWIFGTADDWLVTENSAEGGRTGCINTEWMVEEQTVTLQAAYLLPPEIYNEGELYFNGGEYIDIDFFKQPIQRIHLK